MTQIFHLIFLWADWRFKVQVNTDPRRWFLSDSNAIVNVSALIPVSLPEGSYQVYLNLPDTASRLNSNPAYSIRLANTGIWEDSTGYNSLLHSVTVSKSASAIQKSHPAKDGGRFSFSAYMKAETFSFVIHSKDPGPVSLEIFSLNGRLLSSQKGFFKPNSNVEFSWTRPSNSTFLVKIKQGEKVQEWHTVF